LIMNPMVQVKGIREGILITLGEGPWNELHQALLDHIDQQVGFLKGGRLTLDVGDSILRATDMGQLSRDISDRGLTLWAVLSSSPVTERTAQSFGLATQIAKKRPGQIVSASDMDVQSNEQAVLVRRTLRSGNSLKYAGHVVVIGDVNPGAEIVATGDVVVWGRLRGMVHAGAEGDEQVVVCALDLSPTQLRIGGQVAVTPKRRGKPQPELAHVMNGQVVAETWDPRKEKL
jgi:septum site-determining protein MinC